MAKAHVIGLGRSGIAAAKLLDHEGWEVELGDRATSETLKPLQQQLEGDGITVKLGYSLSLNSSDLPDLIVVSPGVPWDIPVLLEARKRGIDTIGELELAWRHLKMTPWVGITGTNGKTTTTALTAAIFQTAGLQAPACGNIGHAACELALDRGIREQGGRRRGDTETRRGESRGIGEAEEGRGAMLAPGDGEISGPMDWIVAEVSSYQIESSVELAPKIGIWTTFTPDHLSRHYTLENYYNIKASLLRRSQQQIFNGDDPYLRNGGGDSWPEAVWTSVGGKSQLLCEPSRGVYLDDEGWVVAFEERVLPARLLKMVGAHNQQNLLMAVAAAKLAGIENDAIARAIETFPGVPHRLEYIHTHEGVDFINDSKATNYDAAQVGLASVRAPVLLIAGGEVKEGDDSAWLETIKAKAAKVLLIGDGAATFARNLQQSGYEAWEIVETMERAVARSAQLVKQLDLSVVLLSPACASFDQYKSFEHRGEHFRQLCLQL